MSGGRCRTGSVESSPTISTPGRNQKQPWPWRRPWTKMLSLLKVMPSTRPGDLIWPTSEIPTEIPIWRWRSTAWEVSRSWPKLGSSEPASTFPPSRLKSMLRPKASAKWPSEWGSPSLAFPIIPCGTCTSPASRICSTCKRWRKSGTLVRKRRRNGKNE